MPPHQRYLKDISEEEVRILSISAIFNDYFSIDWVHDLAKVKASKIIEALEKSVEKKVLKKISFGTFAFNNNKIRQELLASFSVEELESLHEKAAAILLQDLPYSDKRAMKISGHLKKIANSIEGCRLLAEAGDNFLKEHDYYNSLTCYGKVLKDLKDIFSEDSDTLFVDTAVKYSKISTAALAPKEVLKILNVAMQRAASSKNTEYQALLEMQIAKNEWLQSNYKTSLRHFDRGWSLSKDIVNPKLKRSILTFKTSYPFWYGRYRDVIRSYEESIPEVEKLPNGKFSLFAGTIVGWSYTMMGQISQGVGMLDSIRVHCRKTNDYYVASTASVAIGGGMYEISRIDDAIQFCEEAIRDADRGNCNWAKIWGSLLLANAYYYKGYWKEKGIFYFKQYLKQYDKVEMRVHIFPHLMNLLWLMDTHRIPRIPGFFLAKEIQRAKRSSNVSLKGAAYRYQALLQKKEKQPVNKIIRSLKTSEKYLIASGHQMELDKTRCELVRHYLLINKQEQAEALIESIGSNLAAYDERFIPVDLKPLWKKKKSDKDLLKDIFKYSQDIISIKDRKELVRYIISTANQVTGAERGAIFIKEKKLLSSKLVLKAAKNITAQDVSHSNFTPFREIINDVIDSGKGRILNTDQLIEKETPSIDTIRSCVCFPMKLRGKTIGALYNDNRILNSNFKESDLETLGFFASQVAVAMENAENYEVIQQFNSKLKEEKHYYEEQHLENLHHEEIVGKSSALMNVLKAVEQVANTDASVFIYGETGVGKELVARAIHRNSMRRDRPFIRVHCSSMPETLIPSEMFGHEKGAFTGATQRRIGRFELSDKGTLFIDEIGELPLDVQIQLLRVLQSREFERIGGNKTIQSDFRLIAATNRNLKKMVTDGKFREDLFYRINVFPITVPPLKDRKEDIPLLAHYFLKIYADKLAKPVNAIPDSALSQLLEYNWPGNVRELENIIERGIILSPGSSFVVPDALTFSSGNIYDSEVLTLNENERRHILLALRKTNGKVHGPGGAAALLDINPNTLISRMKKQKLKKASLFR